MKELTLESLGISPNSDDHAYQFLIQTVSETSYVIQAVPIDLQLHEDSCGVLLSLMK